MIEPRCAVCGTPGDGTTCEHDEQADTIGPRGLFGGSAEEISPSPGAEALNLDPCFELLNEAYEEHWPRAVRALFSGGHDSLTATAIAFEWAAKENIDLRAAHINTGTGIPETSEFVRQTCRDNGWPLRELKPDPRQQMVEGEPIPEGLSVYEALVLAFGFPGPAQHDLMFQRLKERPIRQLVREAKREHKDRVMLISGVRKQESKRRTKHVERIQREGAVVWAAPIWDWSKLDCARFIDAQGFPRSPVVDRLEMSGDCLCGAYARPDEMKDLELWYPERAAKLHDLEARAEAKGLRGYIWGQEPPKVHRDQMKLELELEPAPSSTALGVLCNDCPREQIAA